MTTEWLARISFLFLTTIPRALPLFRGVQVGGSGGQTHSQQGQCGEAHRVFLRRLPKAASPDPGYGPQHRETPATTPREWHAQSPKGFRSDCPVGPATSLGNWVYCYCLIVTVSITSGKEGSLSVRGPLRLLRLLHGLAAVE